MGLKYLNGPEEPDETIKVKKPSKKKSVKKSVKKEKK